MDFAIGLVNNILFLTCPMGKWSFLRNSNWRRTVKWILLIKMFLGLVEMTFGLIYSSFSLPEWQDLQMTWVSPFAGSPSYVDIVWMVQIHYNEVRCMYNCTTLYMHCDYNIPLGFKPGQEWVWWDFIITDFFITASQTNHYSSVNCSCVPTPPMPQ